MTSFLVSFYSLFKFWDDHISVLDKTSQQFLAMQWIVTLVRFIYGLVFFAQSLFVHVLDGHFSDFILSWALDGYTLNLGFISSYALDWCTFSFLAQVSSRLMLWTDVPCFIFPLEESLWTIYPCVQGFHSPMLIILFCGSIWMNIQRIPIIYLKTQYIYIYIYIFENPNLCKHSSTSMAHARELVPYWIKNTNQLVHE